MENRLYDAICISFVHFGDVADKIAVSKTSEILYKSCAYMHFALFRPIRRTHIQPAL